MVSGLSHRGCGSFSHSEYWAYLCGKGEPTSGLEPLACSLRVSHQALLEFAWACKFRVSKPISFLCLCPALHRIALPVVSEWCQSRPSFGLYGTPMRLRTRRRAACLADRVAAYDARPVIEQSDTDMLLLAARCPVIPGAVHLTPPVPKEGVRVVPVSQIRARRNPLAAYHSPPPR